MGRVRVWGLGECFGLRVLEGPDGLCTGSIRVSVWALYQYRFYRGFLDFRVDGRANLSRFTDFRATCLHGKPLERTTYTSQHGSGVS